jgi:DNA mismatch repair protein MutS2
MVSMPPSSSASFPVMSLSQDDMTDNSPLPIVKRSVNQWENSESSDLPTANCNGTDANSVDLADVLDLSRPSDSIPDKSFGQNEALQLLEWHRLCEHFATFTATKLGAVVAQQLEIPHTAAETLHLLQQTQEADYLDGKYGGSFGLDGIEDITEALLRAEKLGLLQPLELWHIATTLAGVRNLRRHLDGAADSCPTLQAMIAEVRTYPEIEQDIYHCIDEGGTVLDRASDKLEGIRQGLRQLREQIFRSLQGIMQRNSPALQENIITQRSDRYVLSVKAPQKDRIAGVVHDTSSTGMTLYVEPNAVVPLNNKLRQLLRQEQTEIEVILRRLSDRITTVAEDLQTMMIIVIQIDLALARARYGRWLQGCAPRFSNITNITDLNAGDQGNGTSPTQDQPTYLQKLRHPLLVWQQHHESGAEVVPVDITIQPETKVVVITGPNTGGKTATLKTFGLVALMAKAGMFVPAADPAILPWFDGVYADIGDEQSLQQNLSTFSGHIRRIGRILAAITHQSLILLDEVGAGTDPGEGTAIAIALLQHLANHGALTIATTHFGELKALKYQNTAGSDGSFGEGLFENASVEFDEASLAPTYKLLWGIPGRSNALAIARRLGLPEVILTQAQAHTGYGSEEINAVIAQLERQRREQTDKTAAAAKLLAETERLHTEIHRRYNLLVAESKALREKQEQEVNQAIQQVQKEVGRVIRKLQKGDGTVQDVHFGERRIEELEKRHLPSTPAAVAPVTPVYQPKVGDRVRIPKLGQVAQVLTAPNSGGEFAVRFGQMKLTVTLGDIEKV